MQIEPIPTSHLLPGALPVSDHSRFGSLISKSAPFDRAKTRASLEDAPTPLDLRGEWRRAAIDGEILTGEAKVSISSVSAADSRLWSRVMVPDSYGTDPALQFHHGPVLYSREIVPPPPGRAGFHEFVDLEFDSVDHVADVSLDGVPLGGHRGGGAPFHFDVTDSVSGGSRLFVEVACPLEELDPGQYLTLHRKRQFKGAFIHHDSRPGGLPGRSTPGWTSRLGESMPTGGIIGGVRLRRTGPVRIDSVLVTPLDATGRIHLCLLVTNRSGAVLSAEAQVRIRPPSSATVHQLALACELPPGPSRLDFEAEIADAVAWRPVGDESGRRGGLYNLTAYAVVEGVVSDARPARFGIRRSGLDRGNGRWRMTFNGKAHYLRGACYMGYQHLAGLTEDSYQSDFAAVDDLGLNFLTLASHGQAPAFYELADRLGVLLGQGLPLQWNYESDERLNPGFREESARGAVEFIAALWNHPSVALWYCHNEPSYVWAPDEDPNEVTDYDNQVLDRRLEEVITSLDTERPCHRASGLGDEHRFEGSAAGASLGDFALHSSPFVSEFGFFAPSWRVELLGDSVWPPTGDALTEWSDRLGFAGTVAAYVGAPSRYQMPQDWIYACQRYGALLTKYQIETMRLWRHRDFGGWVINSLVDWRGFGGSGLLDSTRSEKLAYGWLKDANRSVLAIAELPPHPITGGSEMLVPIWVASDSAADTNALVLSWSVRETPDFELITSDPEAIALGASGVPPPARHTVSLPRGSNTGREIASGRFYAPARAESAVLAGEAVFRLPPSREPAGYLLLLSWDSPLGESGANWSHVAVLPDGFEPPPGLWPPPRFDLEVEVATKGVRSSLELTRLHRPTEGRIEAWADEAGVCRFRALPPDAYVVTSSLTGDRLEVELWASTRIAFT